MRLIAIKNLRNEAYQYPDAKKAVEAWYLVMKNLNCSNLEDIRTVYRDAEALSDKFKLSPQIFVVR